MQALVCCTVQGALAPDGGWRCVQVYLVALDIASTKVVLSPTACSVSQLLAARSSLQACSSTTRSKPQTVPPSIVAPTQWSLRSSKGWVRSKLWAAEGAPERVRSERAALELAGELALVLERALERAARHPRPCTWLAQAWRAPSIAGSDSAPSPSCASPSAGTAAAPGRRLCMGLSRASCSWQVARRSDWPALASWSWWHEAARRRSWTTTLGTLQRERSSLGTLR